VTRSGDGCDIAGWILTKPFDAFTASDLTANVRSCRAAKMILKEAQQVLEPLVMGAWLEPDCDLPTNRKWRVNPLLRRHFADRAKAEHERRAEIHQLLKSLAD
jgi:hypothetical protein